MLVARVLEHRHVIDGLTATRYGVVFDDAVREPPRQFVEIDSQARRSRFSEKVIGILSGKSTFGESRIRVAERKRSPELGQ